MKKREIRGLARGRAVPTRASAGSRPSEWEKAEQNLGEEIEERSLFGTERRQRRCWVAALDAYAASFVTSAEAEEDSRAGEPATREVVARDPTIFISCQS
jgi:hypothetical protein